jgi:23S rRNA (uridine2552-2'-O)-methyltransferase
MSRRWLDEQKRDSYHRMAKERGYRSRAAFKLKQLNERFRFLENAKHVLDIGAAPGGWLQVAREAVGEEGLVVGVDLDKIRSLGLENVKTVVGDIMEAETFERIKELLPDRIDVVLSDLAPDVSGAWEVDQFRQVELARAAMSLAREMLRPGGWFIVKVFQGPEYEMYLSEVREVFAFVKVVKPRASRKRSAEVYIVARNLKVD